MKKLLLGLLAAVLLVPVSMAPAEADGTSGDGQLTLTTHDLSLWPDHCGYSGYSIESSFPGAASWRIEVVVRDPSGIEHDRFESADPTTSDASSTSLCQGTDEVGTYSVEATYTTYDADHQQIGSGGTTGTFVLSTHPKYASTLRVIRRPYGHTAWLIKALVTRNGRPWSGHSVQVQIFYAHTWHSVRSFAADRTGHLTLVSRPTRSTFDRYLWRLHSYGGTYVNDAASTYFRLPKR